MLEITNAEASKNILRFANEGRLTQSEWHGLSDDGRELACLLGAIHPSVTSPSQCNGALMPMWLAELTPTLFDGISAAEIAPIARRYGALVARWDALSPEAWDRILTRFLMRTIDEAVEVARPVAEKLPCWAAVEAACNKVKSSLTSGMDLAAAETAAKTAARAAWTASRAAARAAWTAVRAAETAAGRAAETAARAAAVYLRLFVFLLDQIESEVGLIPS